MQRLRRRSSFTLTALLLLTAVGNLRAQVNETKLLGFGGTWYTAHYTLSVNGEDHGLPFRIDPSSVHFVLRNLTAKTSHRLAVGFTLRHCPISRPETLNCLDAVVQMPPLAPGAYEIAAVVGDPNFVRRTNGEPVFVTGFTRPRETAQYFYVSDERTFLPTREGTQPADGFVADRTADDLMKKYGNRPLWFFGDVEFYARCGDRSAVLRVNAPVTISAIHRLRDDWSELPLGNRRELMGVGNYYGVTGQSEMFPDQSQFFTRTPLLVNFTAPAGAVEFPQPKTISHVTSRSTGPGCSNDMYLKVADRWDFERVFSLQDATSLPEAADPYFRAAMLAHHVVPNMSRRMVAFSIGYPSLFGTVQELNRLALWQWYPKTPRAIEVSFRGEFVSHVEHGLK